MKKITHYVRKWRALAAIFLLAAFATSVQAQNVTIRGNNGSTVAAVKNGGTTDTFFGAGGFATWQHEQLSMVLTVSDGTVLTPNGQLDNPANNLFVSSDGTLMQIAKGQATGANVCYATVSLPKGYRFTGYSIKFSKSNETKGSGNGAISFNSNITATFGETASDFGSFTTSASVTNNSGAQTITRTGSEEDMKNVLYFKLTTSEAGYRALITLEHAEFFFTAEENYSPVTPAGTITSPVSAVDVPFATSRVDFGTIENRPYVINGRTYYRTSYSSADVTDLSANFKLFEAESVESGTDIDGVTGGNVVKYDAGTISSAGGYFKLGRENQEQVYYIEAPTTVTISDGHEVPVGYRIIGADFEYTKSAVDGASQRLYIYYDYQGTFDWYPTRYYLYTNGSSVSWSSTNQTEWVIDQDGYIQSASGYYLYFNNGYASVQRDKPAESERFVVSDDGIYQLNYPTYFIRFYRQNGQNIVLVSNTTGSNASYTIISTEEGDETEVSDFVLKVYDKTGTTVAQTRNTANGDTEPITLTGLNNDAVKFSVQGIGLVRATLTLQALDPYLNSMNVICQDQVEEAIRMTQNFTASDFSVSGGEFYFYLPEEAKDHQVQITFEDLESKYFDESYTGGDASHTSRINFVRAAHYDAFGTSNNNIYTNVSEAANAQLERLKVGTVGTAPFRFNNADEVGTSGGTLREFPFSLEIYAKEGGSFDQMFFTVTTSDQSLTRYVFTTDETRYNISPATATQHRAYAYYQMIVHVQTATYEPEVTFKKIYDKTLYRELNEDGTYGGAKEDAFYGAVVTAVDGSGNPGYASTNKIFEKIAEAIADGGDVPADSKHILYLDFSQLKGIYMITDETHQSMDDFSKTNAANCLIFLPAGSAAPNNNVIAPQSEGGAFWAINDIVLTDMQPFFSPYDFTVQATNKATYERKITKSTYGTVQVASVILPFQIKVKDGTPETAGNSQFTIHEMQESNSLVLKDGKTYAYFPEADLKGVSSTVANMPYLLKIAEGANPDENTTFTISQTGAEFKKTEGILAADYTIAGKQSSGTATEGDAAGTYTFTNKGTYAGLKVAKNDNVFYFAKDMFVSSKNLDDGYSYANIAPFRAFYATGSQSAGAKLMSFGIIFGEGEGDVPTAIHAVDAASVIDVNAPVYDLQGRMVATSYSELNGKKLAAGMYVVNGVKFIVK